MSRLPDLSSTVGGVLADGLQRRQQQRQQVEDGGRRRVAHHGRAQRARARRREQRGVQARGRSAGRGERVRVRRAGGVGPHGGDGRRGCVRLGGGAVSVSRLRGVRVAMDLTR